MSAPIADETSQYVNSSVNLSAIDTTKIPEILIRRRYIILGALLPVVSTAAVLAAMVKPVYQSSMTISISSLYQKTKPTSVVDGGENDFTDPGLKVDYTAQLNLMKSSKLIQRAVALLKHNYPDITEEDIVGNGKGNPLEIEQLEEGTGNNKTPSQVFQITYKSNSAVKTQRVLQALQKVYQDYNLEQQKQRLTKGLAFIKEQLPEVRDKVTSAERELKRFRENNNVVDPEIQSKSALDDLASIQKTRREDVAKLQDLQSQYQKLQQQLGRDPVQALIASRLSQSSRYQELLNEIQKTDLEIAKARSVYNDNHPIIVTLLDRRQAQLALLPQEAERVLGSTASQAEPQTLLLQQGQLSKSDIQLVDRVTDVQTQYSGLVASDRKLAEAEGQLRSEIQRYPQLLMEYNRLKPLVEVNNKTLENLLITQQNLALQIAQGGFNWDVLQAPLLGSNVGGGKLRFLVVGAIAGLLLGVIGAILMEILDSTIYSDTQLPTSRAIPLLGKVTRLPVKRKKLGPISKDLFDYPSPRETFDLIYQQIHRRKSIGSLAITSSIAGEGKSTIALGLALSASRAHQRVLLIDADLRNPSLHEPLHLPNNRGLSSLLTTAANPSQTASQFIQQSQLLPDILTAGPVCEDPVALLSSPKMKELIQHFKKIYDLVIIDAPPILGLADALLIEDCCDTALIVAALGQVKLPQLEQAMAMVTHSKIVGIVTNSARSGASPISPNMSPPSSIETFLHQDRRGDDFKMPLSFKERNLG